MSQPTNADIMAKLIEMSEKQAVMDLKIDRVEAQANKTNGRVNGIEDWKNALIAVDQYKKENPSQTIQAPNATTVVVQPQKWFQSKELVGGVVAFLLALAALLTWIAGMAK